MGWFQIISILIALAGYFMSKKSGADDTEAALIGAAAGLGTYYVGTETEWGKDLVSALDGKETLTPALAEDGTKLHDSAGNEVLIPAGSTPVLNGDGTVKTENGSPVVTVKKEDGSVVTTTVSKIAEVLKSWGATGTAAVIGTTAVATSDDKMWTYVAIGAAAFLLLKD